MKDNKRKGFKIIVPVLVIVLLIAAGGLYMMKKLFSPAKESVIMYESKVIENIDNQLKGVDIEAVRSKESLILDKSIEELQTSIKKGDLNYETLTAFYLDRIKHYDKVAKGVNAVAEVNPLAMQEARDRDKSKNTENMPLFGMPLLIKDNINTKNIATSGGTYALKDFLPKENAPVIDTLIKNGAIILGKANLSELAYFMDIKMPSGYNAKSGQTHNPFAPVTISPAGSSSGSAVAAAINLSAAAIGTETTGSIIAPAAIQSVVGFKPSKGLISTEGVLPLSTTMDTVGPIARSVQDVVAVFNASVSDQNKRIVIEVNSEGLKGKRIGLLGGEDNEKLKENLQKQGAIVVDLAFNAKDVENLLLMQQEFGPAFAEYAKKYDLPIKSLAELVEFNKKDEDRRAKYGMGLVEDAAKIEKPDQAQIDALVKKTRAMAEKYFDDNKLDAIAFMDNYGSALACIPGYPEITVPFGKNNKQEPVGATFFSKAGEDEKLVNLAFAFESATKMRQIPEKYKEVVSK